MDFHQQIEVGKRILTLFKAGSEEFQLLFSEVGFVLLDPLFELLTDGHSEGLGSGFGELLVGGAVGEVLIQRKLDVPRPFDYSRAEVFVAGGNNKVFVGEGLLEGMTLRSK